MWKFLEFLGYMAVMLAWVPLAGLLAGGSWRNAKAYTLAWAKAIGWLFAAALLIGAILYPFIG